MSTTLSPNAPLQGVESMCQICALVRGAMGEQGLTPSSIPQASQVFDLSDLAPFAFTVRARTVNVGFGGASRR
jgi:hypothetical protein